MDLNTVAIGEVGVDPTALFLREPRYSAIFEVLWSLKTRGYSESTIDGYGRKLKTLANLVCLTDSEQVKQIILRNSVWSNGYKQGLIHAYTLFAKHYGLKWTATKLRRPRRLPNVPSTEQVNKIIAHSGRKYSVVFSVLRDTGLRPIELSALTLKDLDLEKGVVYPESAKNGSARALKLKPSTLAMLKEYVASRHFKLTDRIFSSPHMIGQMWRRHRDRVADRLHEPELKRFRAYDLRHYFASMLYFKTKDILYVKEQLGHKRLENTLVYTHLVDFGEIEFVCKAAKSSEEASQLIEQNFDYVLTTPEGTMLFRKPK